jgi:precorrin-4/cobalt-precorrin-4 C11-methyltransferase
MIYFIGAGPGAADLITVRGMELLKRAGMVVYAGSLVNPELLRYAPEGCEIHDSAAMTLEEVLEKLRDGAARHDVVVRLHTGDPSIFGAIREQMDALSAYGLAYDVVPGVSSFCAAAAALKAEYTLPDVSQTVILTRMAGRTPVPEKEDIVSLAAHQTTMVLFLSSGMLGELSKKLMEGGYPAETPAAIVHKASWPDEKTIVGTIGEMEQMGERIAVKATALVLVGRFLGNEYSLSKLYDGSFSHGFREAAR